MAESSYRGKFAIASGLFLLLAAGWIWLEQDETQKGPASVQPASVRPSSSEPAPSVPSEPAPEADPAAMMSPPPPKPAEVEQPPASSADAKADPARDQSWIRARYEEAQQRRTAIKAVAIGEHRRLNVPSVSSRTLIRASSTVPLSSMSTWKSSQYGLGSAASGSNRCTLSVTSIG